MQLCKLLSTTNGQCDPSLDVEKLDSNILSSYIRIKPILLHYCVSPYLNRAKLQSRLC